MMIFDSILIEARSAKSKIIDHMSALKKTIKKLKYIQRSIVKYYIGINQ
jgi:hypothetical protein